MSKPKNNKKRQTGRKYNKILCVRPTTYTSFLKIAAKNRWSLVDTAESAINLLLERNGYPPIPNKREQRLAEAG